MTLEDEIDISRGDVVAAASSPAQVADQFAAHLLWMGEHALLPGRPYWLKIGARTVGASVTEIKHRVDVNTQDHLAAKHLELTRSATATCISTSRSPSSRTPTVASSVPSSSSTARPTARSPPHAGTSPSVVPRTSTGSTSKWTRPRAREASARRRAACGSPALKADAATLNASTAAPSNLSGGTLTGGTWEVANGGTLRLASGITTNAATVSLTGGTSNLYAGGAGNVKALAGLASNTGSLTLAGGQVLTTTSDVVNTGTLTVDVTSRLQTGLAGQVSEWAGEGNANDSIGANNGTLQNGATATATGRLGQALSFDGVDDFVNVGDPRAEISTSGVGISPLTSGFGRPHSAASW